MMAYLEGEIPRFLWQTEAAGFNSLLAKVSAVTCVYNIVICFRKHL